MEPPASDDPDRARASHAPGAWKRNLVVLNVGQLVTVSAVGVVIPLIPFFLRDLGMTDRAALERWSGLIFAGPFLAAAVMSPVWGALGDRYGHKKMVVRAIVGLAVVNLLLVFVRSPLQFFLLRFSQGVVTGFVPAALAITSASTPRERLPGAMAQLAASASAGRLLGPAVGGLLAGLLSFRQLFLLVGSIIAAVAVFVLARLEEPADDSRRSRGGLAGPFRWAVGQRRMRLALPGLLASMVAISMTMPVFPLYVEDLVGARADPKLITGIGFAVVACFTLISATILGRIADRVGLKLLLASCLTLAAVALALHPHVHDIPPMLAVRALLGVAAAGIGPVLHAMIARAAPEGMRGGITGLANAATIFGFFVGPVVGGWLSSRIGVDGLFRTAAGVALACAAAAAVATRRVGRDRTIAPLPAETPR